VHGLVLSKGNFKVWRLFDAVGFEAKTEFPEVQTSTL
jgi:hypothetical protein